MSDAVISLMLAAGIGGFTYTRLGRRLGYSNQGNVWGSVAIIFVISFIIMFTLLKFILNI